MDKKRILLVDDEEDLRKMLKFRLEALNYDVVEAADGEDALKKAKSIKPDLMILDLMLPKLDGFEVCKTLKSDENYKNIPIIMFTASAQEKDGELSREVGSDAHITKPFEPQELVEKIKELLK